MNWILRIFAVLLICCVVIALLIVTPHSTTWTALPPDRDCDSVKIYVTSNGVHTDLVVPAVTATKNWLDYLKIETQAAAIFNSAHGSDGWVSLGWGERTFYLEVGDWDNLTLARVWRALFNSPGTLMHVGLYTEAYLKKYALPLMICRKDLILMEEMATASFALDSSGHVQGPIPGYSTSDWFYDAKGNYSLLHNCNAWTADVLRAIRQPTPIWPVYAGAIFYHLPSSP